MTQHAIKKPNPCRFCGNTEYRDVFEYHNPPVGETVFDGLMEDQYYRKILECNICGHMISSHEMNLSEFYSGDYNDSTYKGIEGMMAAFNKITQLKPEQSDNHARCNRIDDYVSSYMTGIKKLDIKLLDVGSGLGVFPWQASQRGYQVTALDPDPSAVKHMKKNLNVKVICANFYEAELNELFDLITFNKVLEHVDNPIAMLKKSSDYLNENGCVYVELPDGERAQYDGSGREEFWIDHLHVFSFSSISLLAYRSGFEPLVVERIQEPSTKFTLRGFLRKIKRSNV